MKRSRKDRIERIKQDLPDWMRDAPELAAKILAMLEVTRPHTALLAALMAAARLLATAPEGSRAGMVAISHQRLDEFIAEELALQKALNEMGGGDDDTQH